MLSNDYVTLYIKAERCRGRTGRVYTKLKTKEQTTPNANALQMRGSVKYLHNA